MPGDVDGPRPVMRDTKPQPREDGPPCREESGVTFEPDFAAERLAGLEVEVVSPVGDAGDLRAAMSDDKRAAISDKQCRRVVFFDELGVVDPQDDALVGLFSDLIA